MSTEIFPPKETPADFKRFDIPVKWGLIIGLLSCTLFTIQNLYLANNLIAYMGDFVLNGIIILVLLTMAAKKQRNAMGGYISLKDAFQCIFVGILIILVIQTIYSHIYLNFIDPDFPVRMKEATLSFTQRMGAPQDKIDEAARRFDEEMKQRQQIGTQVFSFFWSIVIYSIFGFICALIVRKNKPEFGA